MRKEITHTLYLEIDGEDIIWESLNNSKKQEAREKINEKSMRAIGYVPVKKKELGND